MSALVYVDGHRVGSVERGVFKKTVKGSKHFLRKPELSIALDLKSLVRAEELGALYLEIKDSETGILYSVSIAYLRAHGFSVDRGYGAQLALPIRLWASSQRGGPAAEQLRYDADL
jgi:hypothetical protein